MAPDNIQEGRTGRLSNSRRQEMGERAIAMVLENIRYVVATGRSPEKVAAAVGATEDLLAVKFPSEYTFSTRKSDIPR